MERVSEAALAGVVHGPACVAWQRLGQKKLRRVLQGSEVRCLLALTPCGLKFGRGFRPATTPEPSTTGASQNPYARDFVVPGGKALSLTPWREERSEMAPNPKKAEMKRELS